MLRIVAIVVLLALHAASAQACQLRVAPSPTEYPATVFGVSSPDETERQTHIGEAMVGGPVAPRFLTLPRILADFKDERGVRHRIVSAVTQGPLPSSGSAVVIRSRYLDPDNKCQYIPWTVKPQSPTS